MSLLTHYYEKEREITVLQRAVRQNDGKRTYTLLDVEPLQTSIGRDLYYEIAQKANIES